MSLAFAAPSAGQLPVGCQRLHVRRPAAGAEAWFRDPAGQVWRQGPCRSCGRGQVTHRALGHAGWCAECSARAVAQAVQEVQQWQERVDRE